MENTAAKDQAPHDLEKRAQNSDKSGDGLKWFNKLYKNVTQGLKDSIAKGDFKDPKYIEQLDVNFANMYLDAIKNNQQGKDVPGAWKDLFDARQNDRISPIQFAGAGMMAHILHDLPYALEQTNKDMGVTPDKSSTQHTDFEAFNQTLRTTMPDALNLINKGALGHVANYSGSLGQEIALKTMRMMRDGAWNASQHLQAGGKEEKNTQANLEYVSSEAATQILHPGRIPVPGGHIPNPYTEIPVVILNKL